MPSDWQFPKSTPAAACSVGEAVAVYKDGASDWPAFADKAIELIDEERVATVFGCWTPVSL